MTEYLSSQELKKCGYSDVIKVNRIYQCAKCGKIMPPEWAHDVTSTGLKLPKESKK